MIIYAVSDEKIAVDDQNYFICVHSGSRSLGKDVAEYYFSAGQKNLKSLSENIPYELTYLTDALVEMYLQDLQIVQDYIDKKICVKVQFPRRMMKL